MYSLILKLQLLILGLSDAATGRMRKLRAQAERGDNGVGTVLLIIGIIAIATIVVGAITAFVNSKTALIK
jgi:hypothetical protein